MILMQQQMNAFIQENNYGIANPKNNIIIPPMATQSTHGGSKKSRKDPEGESSTSIPTLDGSKIAQKVEEVIQKARTSPRNEEK